MNEFKVSIMQPVVISGNFQEMRQELATMMTAYADLEVTEENIPERKKDIATLRKIWTAIEDKRKETKRDYEKPFKSFEAECKSLTGIIDEQISRINADLNRFEQKRKADKRILIAQIYAQNIGEYVDYVPLDSVYRPQWENKTYTETAIITDIQEAVLTVKNDLRTIDTMCDPWQEECKAVYKASGLNGALQRYKDLESARKTAEASVRGSEHQAPTILPETQEKPVESAVDSDRWVFTVYTKEDADFIRMTLDSLDIQYKEE